MSQVLSELDITKAKLLGSLMTFQQTFFKLRTGADFELSTPPGRECRHITMCRALKRVFNGECKRLIIQLPPRYAKSEWAIGFIAWATANYPDSNHIYVSFAQGVASRQTQFIRDIITHPYYKLLFGVELDGSTAAKHNFRTTAGGEILGVGQGGQITSRGAGKQGATRYAGCIFIDDIHKPEDVYSDVIRTGTKEWLHNTLFSRLNDPINTPIVAIGQSLHEDDAIEYLKQLKKPDGTPEWECVILPALDVHDNPLDPNKHTLEMLLEMKKRSPYVFSAQMQQCPLPAGGGIFKKDDFILLDSTPEILTTFITCDTAETDKTYNDATVFSFFGIYKIKIRGIDTGLYGLHWIDCHELRVEPKDLESEFLAFYMDCMRFHVKPSCAAIEKKSTGVTLCSILKSTPGLRIMEIERTKVSGSKTQRFLECQPYIALHQVTLTQNSKHANLCIEHMSKITANDSHRHDDIADTLSDAIHLTFIDKTLMPRESDQANYILKTAAQQVDTLARIRQGQRA